MKKRINIMIDEEVHLKIKRILAKAPAKPFSRWVNEQAWQLVKNIEMKNNANDKYSNKKQS